MSYGSINVDTITGSGASSVIVNNGTNNVAGFTTGNNIQLLQNGGGIVFSNSSATTNSTLNDYETGTWTPTLGSGTTLVGTFSSIGYYTKVGKTVTVNFRLSSTTTIACTATSALLNNLPFTTSSDGIGSISSLINATGTVGYVFQAYGTNVYPATAITATANIYGSVTYQASF